VDFDRGLAQKGLGIASPKCVIWSVETAAVTAVPDRFFSGMVTGFDSQLAYSIRAHSRLRLETGRSGVTTDIWSVDSATVTTDIDGFFSGVTAVFNGPLAYSIRAFSRPCLKTDRTDVAIRIRAEEPPCPREGRSTVRPQAGLFRKASNPLSVRRSPAAVSQSIDGRGLALICSAITALPACLKAPRFRRLLCSG
jgi:hypothetical protein